MVDELTVMRVDGQGAGWVSQEDRQIWQRSQEVEGGQSFVHIRMSNFGQL
jgi:hypothetical protein